jgi:hypothetical protein
MISGGLAGGFILAVIVSMVNVINIMLSITANEASAEVVIKGSNRQPYFHARSYYICLARTLYNDGDQLTNAFLSAAAAVTMAKLLSISKPAQMFLYTALILAYITYIARIINECYQKATYSD